ncbi:MAG: ATP-binding cassette domain-containing protein, partial [Defluviitaleaceae bacterium]|nr:ATP-binding cassette domain-containing protein [Defluviitaleaceae bacterium]
FSDRITFNNVSFAYTEERGNVLTNFSIDFLKNEWTGIVGASGAGKSTMFDLLLKLYDGYDGDILIDEVSIKNINIQSIRQNITKVSQELFLFPGTLKENLLLIKPDAKELEIMAVLEEVGLTSFVRELPDGLDTNVGEDGVAISGGQKQRICLAMGLLRNSKILLLDEVTANVDNLLEEEIKTNIKKLMEKRDITIIAISHRLQFLDFCDSVFIIDSGKAIRQ